MIRVRKTHFDPTRLRHALGRADRVVIDLETTGLGRHDRIVAVGVLADRDAHILLTAEHGDLSGLPYRVDPARIAWALEPLATRPELVVVFHNAVFDLGVLGRAGVEVRARVHDTLKLLKLLDPDRGVEKDDGGVGSRMPRLDRRFSEPLNYRLKDVARTLLVLQAQDYPGGVARLPFDRLVRYLKSDLLVTELLYRYLQQRLAADDRDYNERLVAPVTPLLVGLTLTGVQADSAFLAAEVDRLRNLLAAISAAHAERFAQPLDVGDVALRRWIYGPGLGCRVISSGKGRLPSLKAEDLVRLAGEGSPAAKDSLALIHDYKLAQGLLTRLAALERHVDPATGRIHSTFNDLQATGRVSSTRPNLQQVAGEVGPGRKKQFRSERFRGVSVRSRNVLVASPGHRLVAFDIAQADIRVLAHAVESFPLSGGEHIAALQEERGRRQKRAVKHYRRRMWEHFRPENRQPIRCPACGETIDRSIVPPGHRGPCPKCGRPLTGGAEEAEFDPSRPCELAEDFRRGGTDFYSTAAERMLGRPPRDKTERDHMKQTVLGIVNGMGAAALAKRLGVTAAVAAGYLAAFGRAYPQVTAYTRLMHHAFAVTGRARTFAGRTRRSTAQWWMARRSVVDLFVSYRGADKLWLRVVPLRPGRHTLTCWVLRAVDVRRGSPNEGQEIYHHKVGRISQAPYRFFGESGLVFRLPVRNVAWRLIRRVRTPREEAVYEGFDKVRRQLFNHIAQGGTADVAKTMMLRAEPVCRAFGAGPLIQIHDELVFEVPARRLGRFARRMKRTLEEPPAPDFRVPIVVEPKAGERFGELAGLGPETLSPYWIQRVYHRLRGWIRRVWRVRRRA
ncbi:DNA polymerase [Gemmata sp. JC717]|uniref:DNA polymerase n=1 Tax=Gemmata algarum TaxID=2975278 RepID=UPI0021BBB6A4|nr:DNA polymerase [Gemmata algarum]MDY3555982.1 DNA polymerase [Gemmata algarum]